jgi:ectoine hydroxylase-related dioxygenase (phytanoyl-CoA dioxygenase family)
MQDRATIAKNYHDDGFVIVRNLFSSDEIADLDAELQNFADNVAPTLDPGDVYYEDDKAKSIKSAFRLQSHSEAFDRLRNDPRLIEIVQAIYSGSEIIPATVMFFAKSARNGSVTPPHQDNGFQFWNPPEALTATVAIDESMPSNGPLILQRGSHKNGLLPHRPSGVLGFSQTLIDPLDTKEYPEIGACLAPGDLLLHSVDTVHRSGANGSSRHRRQIGIGFRSQRAAPDEQARERYQRTLNELHKSA